MQNLFNPQIMYVLLESVLPSFSFVLQTSPSSILNIHLSVRPFFPTLFSPSSVNLTQSLLLKCSNSNTHFLENLRTDSCQTSGQRRALTGRDCRWQLSPSSAILGKGQHGPKTKEVVPLTRCEFRMRRNRASFESHAK